MLRGSHERGSEIKLILKGKLGEKILSAKVFPTLIREVSEGNFNQKTPKSVKNQVKGSKTDQIRTKGQQLL